MKVKENLGTLAQGFLLCLLFVSPVAVCPICEMSDFTSAAKAGVTQFLLEQGSTAQGRARLSLCPLGSVRTSFKKFQLQMLLCTLAHTSLNH